MFKKNQREKIIGVRLSEYEKQMIEKAANEENRDMSNYVRNASLQRAKRADDGQTKS